MDGLLTRFKPCGVVAVGAVPEQLDVVENGLQDGGATSPLHPVVVVVVALYHVVT